MTKETQINQKASQEVMGDDLPAEEQADAAAMEAGTESAEEGSESDVQDGEAAEKDDVVAELEAAIAALQEENAELKEGMVRVQAEMENTRRRSRQEVDKARKFGMEKLIEDLLPVLDSLDLGLKSIEEHGDEVSKLKEGYEMIASMFTGIMERSGVKAIDPQGEAFDPERHQAMTTEPSDEVKPNHVLRVFQKGYSLNERLVRPAMVVISVAAPKKTEEKAGADKDGE